MAISETVLKDVTLMASMKSTPAARAGRSSRRWLWILHPTGRCSPKRPRQLISQDKVEVVFGCWTRSRKSVLPVFEELKRPALLSGAYKARNSPRTSSTLVGAHQQAIPRSNI